MNTELIESYLLTCIIINSNGVQSLTFGFTVTRMTLITIRIYNQITTAGKKPIKHALYNTHCITTFCIRFPKCRD